MCVYVGTYLFIFTEIASFFLCFHAWVYYLSPTAQEKTNNNKTDSLIHDFTGTWRINVPSSSYVFTCNLLVVLKTFSQINSFTGTALLTTDQRSSPT